MDNDVLNLSYNVIKSAESLSEDGEKHTNDLGSISHDGKEHTNDLEVREALQMVKDDEDIDTDNEEKGCVTSVGNEFIEMESLFGKTGFVFLYGKVRSSARYCSKVNQYKIYALFFDEEIVELIVQETNRFDDQKLGAKSPNPQSRLKKWKPTTLDKITKFWTAIMVGS